MKCSYCGSSDYLIIKCGEIVCTNKHVEDNMVCFSK
jgi:hypothetical protein